MCDPGGKKKSVFIDFHQINVTRYKHQFYMFKANIPLFIFPWNKGEII